MLFLNNQFSDGVVDSQYVHSESLMVNQILLVRHGPTRENTVVSDAASDTMTEPQKYYVIKLTEPPTWDSVKDKDGSIKKILTLKGDYFEVANENNTLSYKRSAAFVSFTKHKNDSLILEADDVSDINSNIAKFTKVAEGILESEFYGHKALETDPINRVLNTLDTDKVVLKKLVKDVSKELKLHPEKGLKSATNIKNEYFTDKTLPFKDFKTQLKRTWDVLEQLRFGQSVIDPTLLSLPSEEVEDLKRLANGELTYFDREAWEDITLKLPKKKQQIAERMYATLESYRFTDERLPKGDYFMMPLSKTEGFEYVSKDIGTPFSGSWLKQRMHGNYGSFYINQKSLFDVGNAGPFLDLVVDEGPLEISGINEITDIRDTNLEDMKRKELEDRYRREENNARYPRKPGARKISGRGSQAVDVPSWLKDNPETNITLAGQVVKARDVGITKDGKYYIDTQELRTAKSIVIGDKTLKEVLSGAVPTVKAVVESGTKYSLPKRLLWFMNTEADPVIDINTWLQLIVAGGAKDTDRNEVNKFSELFEGMRYVIGSKKVDTYREFKGLLTVKDKDWIYGLLNDVKEELGGNFDPMKLMSWSSSYHKSLISSVKNNLIEADKEWESNDYLTRTLEYIQENHASIFPEALKIYERSDVDNKGYRMFQDTVVRLAVRGIHPKGGRSSEGPNPYGVEPAISEHELTNKYTELGEDEGVSLEDIAGTGKELNPEDAIFKETESGIPLVTPRELKDFLDPNKNTSMADILKGYAKASDEAKGVLNSRLFGYQVTDLQSGSSISKITNEDIESLLSNDVKGLRLFGSEEDIATIGRLSTDQVVQLSEELGVTDSVFGNKSFEDVDSIYSALGSKLARLRSEFTIKKAGLGGVENKLLLNELLSGRMATHLIAKQEKLEESIESVASYASYEGEVPLSVRGLNAIQEEFVDSNIKVIDDTGTSSDYLGNGGLRRSGGKEELAVPGGDTRRYFGTKEVQTAIFNVRGTIQDGGKEIPISSFGGVTVVPQSAMFPEEVKNINTLLSQVKEGSSPKVHFLDTENYFIERTGEQQSIWGTSIVSTTVKDGKFVIDESKSYTPQHLDLRTENYKRLSAERERLNGQKKISRLVKELRARVGPEQKDSFVVIQNAKHDISIILATLEGSLTGDVSHDEQIKADIDYIEKVVKPRIIDLQTWSQAAELGPNFNIQDRARALGILKETLEGTEKEAHKAKEDAVISVAVAQEDLNRTIDRAGKDAITEVSAKGKYLLMSGRLPILVDRIREAQGDVPIQITGKLLREDMSLTDPMVTSAQTGSSIGARINGPNPIYKLVDTEEEAKEHFKVEAHRESIERRVREMISDAPDLREEDAFKAKVSSAYEKARNDEERLSVIQRAMTDEYLGTLSEKRGDNRRYFMERWLSAKENEASLRNPMQRLIQVESNKIVNARAQNQDRILSVLDTAYRDKIISKGEYLKASRAFQRISEQVLEQPKRELPRAERTIDLFAFRGDYAIRNKIQAGKKEEDIQNTLMRHAYDSNRKLFDLVDSITDESTPERVEQARQLMLRTLNMSLRGSEPEFRKQRYFKSMREMVRGVHDLVNSNTPLASGKVYDQMLLAQETSVEEAANKLHKAIDMEITQEEYSGKITADRASELSRRLQETASEYKYLSRSHLISIGKEVPIGERQVPEGAERITPILMSHPVEQEQTVSEEETAIRGKVNTSKVAEVSDRILKYKGGKDPNLLWGLAGIGIAAAAYSAYSSNRQKKLDSAASIPKYTDEYNKGNLSSKQDSDFKEGAVKAYKKLKVDISVHHGGLFGGNRLDDEALEALSKDISQVMERHFEAPADHSYSSEHDRDNMTPEASRALAEEALSRHGG